MKIYFNDDNTAKLKINDIRYPYRDNNKMEFELGETETEDMLGYCLREFLKRKIVRMLDHDEEYEHVLADESLLDEVIDDLTYQVESDIDMERITHCIEFFKWQRTPELPCPY